MPDTETTDVAQSESISGKQLIRQTAISFLGGEYLLSKALPFTYTVAREMRKDPTIALARSVLMSPIENNEWSVEADEVDEKDGVAVALRDRKIEFVTEEIVDRRQEIVETALKMLDFGFAAWEKVFYLRGDGLIGISPLKPLLHDITTILIDVVTGSFQGFQQDNDGRRVTIPLQHSLLLSYDVDGQEWYGNGLLQNAKRAYDDWLLSNDGATRYDEKIAGTQLVVYYPAGQESIIDGASVSNLEIAESILAGWKSTGKIAVPSSVKDVPGWKIELLSDEGDGQGAFIPRQKYLDSLKFRAFMVPERSAMEGQFGTKAEAATHIDVVVQTMTKIDQLIARMINWHLVNQLLTLNYGPDAAGTVKIVAAPLADKKIAWFREVYMAVLNNPSGFMQELPSIDIESLREQVGVPGQDPDELGIPIVGVNADDDPDGMIGMVTGRRDA